jgi:tRNA(fMet)-specific endonuclease VapC
LKKTYMLDTNICSFIMRERPLELLKILQKHVEAKDRLVVSAITYAEMRFGAIGKKLSPKHNVIVDEFMSRIESVLPWDKEAVDATTKIKKYLSDSGTPIGANDSAIAGHAIAIACVLVTNNTKEFARVEGLSIEDWTK